jgi:DegV family protein with EDD domain
MNLGVVTDSTSDLPADLLARHDIQVVPAILVVDGKEYRDGTEISREEFYLRLPSLRTPPTTAAPSIEDFARQYRALLARGCGAILSIHAASQLTAIVNVARQAAREFGSRVTCVDSGSLSLGLGFQALAAAEAAQAAPAEDSGLHAALQAVESTRRRLRVSAALDTMHYLRRSGRVPAAAAALGSLLSIRPLIELSDGAVKAIGAVRTTGRADERMLNYLVEGGPLERLAILHTNAERRAKRLLQGLMERVRRSLPREILLVNVTTIIGTHVGPNGLGFAAIGLQARP